MESRSRVYYTVGQFREFDRRMLEWISRARAGARHGRGMDEFVMLDHSRPRNAAVQEQGGDPCHVEGGPHQRRRARARHAHVPPRHDRVPDRSRGHARVRPLGVPRRGVSVHRGQRRECVRPALHRELRPPAQRRARADRRRCGVRLLRGGHHPHVPGRRQVLRRAARRLPPSFSKRRRRPSPPWRRAGTYDDVHTAAVEVLARGLADPGRDQGWREAHPPEGEVQAFLHAPHRPLARHGRARRRGLPHRRPVTRARGRGW